MHQNLSISQVSGEGRGGSPRYCERSECSFCRLIVDCFLRLSLEEITSCGFESSNYEWCFDGVVWLSLPVGDHPINETKTDNSSRAPKWTDMTRIMLSIFPQEKEPNESKFWPPFDFLHTDVLPFTEEDDAPFQVFKVFDVIHWCFQAAEIAPRMLKTPPQGVLYI